MSTNAPESELPGTCEAANNHQLGGAPPLPGLWSAKTTATFCGFESPVTILRAFRRGDLPGFKFGPRTVRFNPSDVKKWIAAARVG